MSKLNIKAVGLFILTFMFAGVFALKAATKVDRVSIEPKYFINGKLYIANPAVVTSFQYLVTLNRGLLPNGFPDGTCKLQVMYSSCATCPVSSYVPISAERNIVNADYKTNSGIASAFADLSLVSNLPANTTTGGVLLKFTYDENGKTETKYLSDNFISIQTGSSNSIDPSDLAKIQQMGFNTLGITADSEQYIVEDDIALLRTYVHVYPANNQKITNSNINILVDQSIWTSRSVWYSSVKEAIKVWNTNPNSNIKLHFFQSAYDNPARVDIYIRPDNGQLPANVAARSRFPSGDGKAGNMILVNTDFDGRSSSPFGNLTPEQATWNMLHQIGHCLGLKHTSETLTDPSSLMTRSSFYNEYNRSNRGLIYALPSVNDENVINTQYPLDKNSSLEPAISGGSDWYYASYISKENGVNYRWEMVGMDDVSDYFDFGKLPDTNDPAFDSSYLGKHGTFKLRCTISGGKYVNPKTAMRIVTY